MRKKLNAHAINAVRWSVRKIFRAENVAGAKTNAIKVIVAAGAAVQYWIFVILVRIAWIARSVQTVTLVTAQTIVVAEPSVVFVLITTHSMSVIVLRLVVVVVRARCVQLMELVNVSRARVMRIVPVKVAVVPIIANANAVVVNVRRVENVNVNPALVTRIVVSAVF